MTIAITGATGALGSLVLEALLRTEDPADLVAVVRDPAKAASVAARGVDVRTAAYDDPGALRAALQGVDTLLLISGSEVGSRVPQHANVIEAAKQAGVRRIVYTSAPKATDTPLVLAPEHKATEELLAASGLAVTVLRNNWYNENYLPQIEAVRQTGILLGAAGDGRVASAARRDFADAAAAVLTGEGHEGKTYELTGDTAWTYDDLAAALSEATGRDVVYKPVSAAELVRALVDAGLDEGSARFVAALDENIAAGTLADVDPTLSRLIGRPTTPLVETLRG